MAAVAYRCDFKGELGTQYRIDIWDAESSAASPETFKCEAPGFTLEYQGAGEDDITAHTIGSQVNVSFLVENSTQQTFIQSIIDSVTHRFYLKIYRESQIFWIGYLDYSGQEMADDYYPYVFIINAVDRLGTLSLQGASIDYNPVDTTDTLNFGRKTLGYYLQHILNITGLHLIIPTGDKFIEFISEWWCEDIEITMAPQPATPTTYCFFNEVAFHPYSINNTKMNAFEAFEMILNLFNLRVFQSNGSFIIEHMYAKMKSSYYVWDYSNDPTPTITCTTAQKYITESADFTKLSGCVYKFSKPLKRAIMKYEDEIWYSSGGIDKYSVIDTLAINSGATTWLEEINIGTVTVGTHAEFTNGGTTYHAAGTLWTRGHATLQPSVLARDYWCDSSLSGFAYRHAKTLLNDHVSMRKTALKLFSGSIQTADYSAHKTLIFSNDDEYHFLRGSFAAMDEIWQGEWVKYSRSYTDIDFNSDETYTDK